MGSDGGTGSVAPQAPGKEEKLFTSHSPILKRILFIDLSLADVLTPANLAPIFSSPDLLRAIFPHLPPDLPVPPSAEALQRIIESPQFHSAVRTLDQALATGLLGGLVRGLGLPEEAGTGVVAFLNAIKNQVERAGRSGNDDTMETD